METLTQAALTANVLETMEDEFRISKKQAKDFIESTIAVIEEALDGGQKISLWGIVTLTPSFKAARPKRKGIDPRTQEEKVFDAQPAKVKIKATVSPRIKAALPEPTSKAGKVLKADAAAKAQAAEDRKAAREEEAAKAQRKADREAKKAEKPAAKKPGGKK